MAFNKEQTNDVVQTGLSNFSRQTQPDESLGILFEGLGKSINNTMNALDDSNKMQINLDATKAVDAAVNQHMPPAIQEFQGNIADLQNARDQGTYSEVAYKTTLLQKSKEMISRFPQYADVINQSLASAEGTSVANDLRKARSAEIDSEKAATDKKYTERKQFFDANDQIIGQAEVQRRYQELSGQKYELGSMDFDESAMRRAVAEKKATIAVMAQKQAEASFNHAVAPDYAMQKLNTLARSQFSQIGNTQLGAFLAQAQEFQKSGGQIDPEEFKILTQRWNQLKTLGLAAGEEALSDPNDPGLKGLQANDRTTALAAHKSKYEVYEQMLVSKDFGLLGQVQREFERDQVQLQSDLLKSSPATATIIAFSKMGLPPELVQNIFVDSDKAFVGDRIKSEIANAAVSAMATGKTTLNDAEKDWIKNSGSKNPGPMIDHVTNQLGKLLSDPNTPDEALVSVAKNIFRKENQDYLQKLKPAERLEVFKRLVKPSMVQRLTAAGDQKALKSLNDWATMQFDTLSAPARDTLLDAQVDSDFSNVTFDGKRFIVAPNGLAVSKGLVGAITNPLQTIQNGVEYMKYSAAASAASTLNQYLETMTPIWEANGMDPKATLDKLMQGSAIENQVKQGNFFTKLQTSIHDYIYPPEDKPSMKGRSLTDAAGKTNSSYDSLFVSGAQAAVPEQASLDPEQQQLSASAGVQDVVSQGDPRWNTFGDLASVDGFVIHHTGGRGNVGGVINTFKERGYPAQYVIDRNGKIYQTLPDGKQGRQIKTSVDGKLNNTNTIGVEVIAKDDTDILPIQEEAAAKLYDLLQKKYPDLGPDKVFGHGEVNTHKQATEGSTIAGFLRNKYGKKKVASSD